MESKSNIQNLVKKAKTNYQSKDNKSVIDS